MAGGDLSADQERVGRPVPRHEADQPVAVEKAMVLGPRRSDDLLRLSQGMREAGRHDDDAVGRERLPRPGADSQAARPAQDVVDRDGLERTEPQLPSALDAADREGAQAHGQRHQEAIEEVCPHASGLSSRRRCRT